MSLEYIRKTYGVPAKRGKLVQWTDALGHYHTCKIKSGDHHLIISPIHDPKTRLRVHPTGAGLKY